MAPFPRNALALLVSCCVSPLVSAQGMAPLQVDPALLGLPPHLPASANSAPVEVTPVPVAPVEAADLTPAEAAPAEVGPAEAAPGEASPSVLPAPPAAIEKAVHEPAPAVTRPARVIEKPQTVTMPPPVERQPRAAIAPAPQTPQSVNADRPPVPPAPVRRSSAPTASDESVLTADRVFGANDRELVAEGNAELVRGAKTLTADRLIYRHDADEAEAEGNVRLTQDGDAIEGPQLTLQMATHTGRFEQPSYLLQRPGEPARGTQDQTAHGQAAHVDLEGENRYRFHKVTYSTCQPGASDWVLKSDDLQLDYDTQHGVAKHATVEFMDVPIFYWPYFSFPLNESRQSGVLAPSFGSSSKTGADVSMPYYWNIAPNRDATIVPRYLSKRGLMMGGEFRYLEPSYAGFVQAEYLGSDKIRKRDRWSASMNHTHRFSPHLSGTFNWNGVSDDRFFDDMTSRLTSTSQGNLLREGTLSYSGGWWNVTGRAQSWQTLQPDPDNPDVNLEPYARLPQVQFNLRRPDQMGLDLGMQSEWVSFRHGNVSKVEGDRLTVYPHVSLPLVRPGFYITPKLGVHYTQYNLKRQGAGVPGSQNRDVPIFSIDSGMFFERETDFLGLGYQQTLEPRLYYLNVPARDQNNIPLFDTGEADFNFAQIFSENLFSGGDRIADANQLTAAVTSRLINPLNGSERMRFMLGQRFYFRDQAVTLNSADPKRTTRETDLLAAFSGRVATRWMADGAWQYNPNASRTERFTVSTRYQPGHAKVIGGAYRYVRDSSGLQPVRSFDIHGQWPLGGGYYGVGRFDYSIQESRLVEGVAGLEYNDGCWILRVVGQRVQVSATDKPSTAIFVQLELSGLGRIGSDPLDMLRRRVPGYGLINRPAVDPVFGTY